MKKCSECSVEKDASYFPSDGNKCIKCILIFKKKFSKENISEFRKNYYEDNKNIVIDILNNYYSNNKDIKEQKRKSSRNNYQNNKFENNRGYKIEKRLIVSGDEVIRSIKSIISLSFRRKFIRKPKRTNEILGINYDEFKKYLESKFIDDMSWSNFNTHWKIDYIEPIPNIIRNKETICNLNHYTNFQPISLADKG